MPKQLTLVKNKIKKQASKNVKQTTELLRDRRNWFEFLLNGIGYQFPGMFMSLVTIGLITALLVYTHTILDISLKVPSTFHTVLGLVVGLLLVFRTNTAYDRWWDGRKQLGGLTNHSRSFAIRIQANIEDPALRHELLTLISCFVYATKEHLRQQKFDYILAKLPQSLVEGFAASGHKPVFLLNRMSYLLNFAYKKHEIDGSQLLVLEGLVSEFSNCLGACERINNTPMPIGYSLHLKRILLIYLITLPTGFIADLEWWAIPVVMLIFYTMVGIELIGEEIEGPFGTDTNDLPFDVISERIENVVEQVRNTEF
jgi:putative membrane protein